MFSMDVISSEWGVKRFDMEKGIRKIFLVTTVSIYNKLLCWRASLQIGHLLLW